MDEATIASAVLVTGLIFGCGGFFLGLLTAALLRAASERQASESRRELLLDYDNDNLDSLGCRQWFLGKRGGQECKEQDCGCDGCGGGCEDGINDEGDDVPHW